MTHVLCLPRVVLADDHPIVRHGIRAALEASGAAKVVGEAGTPQELLALIALLEPDLIVTDFSMPSDHGRDGLQLIRHIRGYYPALRIVVITALKNPGLCTAMLAHGVSGLIGKDGDVNELGIAIQTALHGRTFVSPAIRTLLLEHGIVQPSTGVSKLTEAEMEVLRLFAHDGLTSQQIAERLNRSRKTISRHKRSAQTKLGLATNQELIEYCRRINLGLGN